MPEYIQDGSWGLRLRTIDIDSSCCYYTPGDGRIPLLRGRNIWQFTSAYAPPNIWVDKDYATEVAGDDWFRYRIGIRNVTQCLNPRSLICTVLPPGTISNSSIHTSVAPEDPVDILVLCALMNSYTADWEFRMALVTTVAISTVHQLHIPHPIPGSPLYTEIAQATAKLIFRNNPFDPLSKMMCNSMGVCDDIEYGYLRCRVETLCALAYGLQKEDFRRVLGTFSSIPPEVRYATLNEFVRLERKMIQNG